MSQANRYLGGFCSSQRIFPPQIIQVLLFSYSGAMRRNGTRFARISVGGRGHQTLLLRLSAVLRNAVVMCSSLITPYNCWHNTTWPEFQPSLPPGH